MKVKEQVATNTAGSGAIAGIGVGLQGEPGVYPKKKLRKIVLSKQPLKRLTPINR